MPHIWQKPWLYLNQVQDLRLVDPFSCMSPPDDDEAIDFCKRQYLQQIPVRHFQWPNSLPLIQFSLWDYVFFPGIHKFPPGDRYQYLILRDLVTRLENEEIDERLIQRYTTLLQNPPTVVPPTIEAVITYTAPKIGEIYISEQPFLIVSGGTTGLRTWEASLLLSEWLLEQNTRGKCVLELGAGTGPVGILAAKMGAKVMATDGSDMVVTKLRRNFELNDVFVESGVLWWGEENEILQRTWDLIVGADITYDEDVCSSLAETYALGIKHGATGILAATVRNENTLMAFVKECELKGLHIEEIPGWDRLKGIFFCNTTFPMKLLRLTAKE